MASSTRKASSTSDRVKWTFFALIALSILLIIWADEGFVIDPADPHWKHIAPVKWLLLIHACGGITALATGALQMSSRIRARRPALHRALGKVYLVAVIVSAPFAIYIGTSATEPASIHIEQIFQGGLWLLSALVAWAWIRSGQMQMHKAWMIRSYAFTLVFVLSRVPDAFVAPYSDQALSDMLWSLVVIAVIAPEIILGALAAARLRASRNSASAKLAETLSTLHRAP